MESEDITFLPPDKHTEIKRGAELVKIYIKDRKELFITHIGATSLASPETLSHLNKKQKGTILP